jgi:endoglucanase
MKRFLPLVLSCFLASALPAAESASAIRLNTLGYLPAAPKHASIARAAKGAEFRLIRLHDKSVVASGKVETFVQNQDTGEDLAIVDFSSVSAPGEYRLVVAGVGESPVFKISPTLYTEPFFLVTRAMYLWRCGVEVEGEWNGRRFHHAACHVDDAWMDHATGKHEKVNSVGGWHDAGDYNKYVTNAGVTVGAMLRAWEEFKPQIEKISLRIPESGGKLPDYLAEIKFETDWLLTMQAADGSVYHKVSTERFGPFVMPEKEKAPRYFCPGGSISEANFVAMLAQAARAIRPYEPEYADRLLAAAVKTYRHLVAHPADRPPDMSKFKTGPYLSKDPDERLWAAAEIWETTGDATALADLETRIRALRPKFQEDFDWGELKNLGLLAYLFSSREGRDPALVDALRQNLIQVADTIVAKSRKHGYARPLFDRYYWGCNGGVVRQAMLLHAAYRLNKNEAYRAAILDGINHVFGRNIHGRSYVTGLGFNPPKAPHDRRSGGDKVDEPWPGYLVGGPHPAAKDWYDVEPDARTNEIAINWNGALIYALGAALAMQPE